MTDARQRLMEALPALKIAMVSAKIQIPKGTVKLAVVAQLPDGSGQVTAFFEGEDFINDIVTVLGFKDMTEIVLATDQIDD